jgi:hypothetical protein
MRVALEHPSELGVVAAPEVLAQDAAADAVARLEDDHGPAGLNDAASGRQPGEAGADDDHVRACGGCRLSGRRSRGSRQRGPRRSRCRSADEPAACKSLSPHFLPFAAHAP